MTASEDPTMEAWQWTGTGRPLSRHTVPVPEPGPGEVLIAVHAAGMCHSDVGELDEPSWAVNILRNPITLGHEIAGTVAATGSAVSHVGRGAAVAVYPQGRTVPGYGRDGGYAAYTVAPAEDVVPLPTGMPFDVAAIATDAGMTSYHAVVTAGEARAGLRIGIIGLGGLGLIGARVAVLQGAEVHAVDPREAARALGERQQVHEVVAAASELEGRELDVVVDFAGAGSTTDSAVRAIRKGGTVVMVGLGAEFTRLVTADVIHQRARILGSSGGTRDDLRAVLELISSGAVVPEVEHLGFDNVPEGIDRLRAGTVSGRLVVKMSDHRERGFTR